MEQATAKPALDLGRCLNDAMEVYRKNVLTFVLAVILFDLLMICSLLVLTGPLMGGMILLCLTAMRDPEHKAKLGDLFGMFNRFGPFVALFVLMGSPSCSGTPCSSFPASCCRPCGCSPATSWSTAIWA